jgi:hypothetical protein
MECKVSSKPHSLHSHLVSLPTSFGDTNYKHAQCVRQEVCMIDKRRQGKWSPCMLAESAYRGKGCHYSKFMRKSSLATVQVN